MTTREWESVLNIKLSHIFRDLGLNCRPEVIHPGGDRVDVEVRIGNIVVAVEAKHGTNPAQRNEAVNQCDDRIEKGLAQCAVAVCYTNDTTEESLLHSQVSWTVRDGNNTSAEWTSGDIDQLVSAIRLTPAQLGDPDAAAASLSTSLDGAVRHLSEEQKQHLARALDLPQQTKDGKPTAHPWEAPTKRALLVIATAVMFHSRLDVHLPQMRPELDNRLSPPKPFTGPWPPTPAHVCLNSDAKIQAYADAWHLILALDYKPIFETGRAALMACPPDPSFAAAVRDTARAALAVAENIASLRHDLLGRIFHTVLDTARYDGSFYTTTPAATLLAALAITNEMCDWQNPEAISKLRITDPACGTGTLLMAAAERIRELAPQARDDEQLAAALIEQVLAGYDVNLTATHMAATTLGLLSPTTRFQNMKIGRAFLGVDEAGKAYLGSLEFLDQQPKLMAWPNAVQAITQVESGEEIARAEPADLVIMNPPFTKHDLRHQQFEIEEKNKLEAREKRLFANKPVHLSSNSHTFLFLAEYMNKRESGTVASVLPLANATNISALAIRQYLASHYHIETIVTTYDHDRAYFSENTTISEMLLICRRWSGKHHEKPPTKVVNLAINPATPADALNVARMILEGKVMEQGHGTVQEWPAARISNGNWGAVRFFSPFLCEQFVAIQGGQKFATKRISEIAEVGPHGVGTRMNFSRSDFPDAAGRVALWYHKANVIRTLRAQPDTNIVAKPGKSHLAENQWNGRGKLMLPERIRFNTDRTVSVRLDDRVAASAWIVCKPALPEIHADILEKAICVYLNSSLGILTLLDTRSSKTLSYVYFSLGDIKSLLVPDFATLGEGVASKLAEAYDQHSDSVMLPLPQMDKCPVRRELDRAVGKALGVEEETVAGIRRQLSLEPSITGERYAGLGS